MRSVIMCVFRVECKDENEVNVENPRGCYNPRTRTITNWQTDTFALNAIGSHSTVG